MNVRLCTATQCLFGCRHINDGTEATLHTCVEQISVLWHMSRMHAIHQPFTILLTLVQSCNELCSPIFPGPLSQKAQGSTSLLSPHVPKHTKRRCDTHAYFSIYACPYTAQSFRADVYPSLLPKIQVRTMCRGKGVCWLAVVGIMLEADGPKTLQADLKSALARFRKPKLTGLTI